LNQDEDRYRLGLIQYQNFPLDPESQLGAGAEFFITFPAD
jgi:hypothetical protein